jgi:putative FmdB family regulatory protein
MRMPLYEYQCTACNERSEVLQRLGEAPIEVCSTCGGPLRKLISSPAFQFRGSGWYATDYAHKSGSSGGSGGGDSGGDSSSVEGVSSSTSTGGKSGETKSDGGGAEKSDAKKANKAESKATSGA